MKNKEKELDVIIIRHHPYYNYKNCCCSTTGVTGWNKNSKTKNSCISCEYNKFGSGENGSKACHCSRILYYITDIYSEPMIIELTNNLNEFSKYIMSLIKDNIQSFQVVTKIIQDSNNNYKFEYVKTLDKETQKLIDSIRKNYDVETQLKEYIKRKR